MGETFQLAALQVGPVQIEDPVLPVRGEVDEPLVPRQDRSLVVARPEADLLAIARVGQVDPDQLHRPADLGRVDHRLALGGEGRRGIVGLVVGEIGHLLGFEVDQVDIGLASFERPKSDRSAVWREGRLHALVDGQGDVDHAFDATLVGIEQEQIPLALGPREHRDRVPVRREGQVTSVVVAHGQILGDEVVEAVGVVLAQVAVQTPIGHPEEHHVDVALVGRERGHDVARGRRHRGDLLRSSSGCGPESAAELPWGTTLLKGAVLLAQPGPEGGVELLDVHVEDPRERTLDAAPEGVPEREDELAHDILAPLLLDELEDLVAEPVGVEALHPGPHRRHLVREHRITHVHLVTGILVVSVVGGHALHEPGRRASVDGATGATLVEDLVLEDVGQLVLNQGLQRPVRQVDREDHAVAHRGGERPDALGDETDQDVGLLELRMGGIEDQRNRLEDLEVELAGELVIGALCKGRDLLQVGLDPVVVGDSEVR